MRASPQSVRYRKEPTAWLMTWPHRSGINWNSVISSLNQRPHAIDGGVGCREDRGRDGCADGSSGKGGGKVGEHDGVAVRELRRVFGDQAVVGVGVALAQQVDGIPLVAIQRQAA